jgi:nicotinamide mononucleotide adenylyltransferase
MSQPYIYDVLEPKLFRTNTVNPPLKSRRVDTDMPRSKAEQKIAEFESYINRNVGITEGEVDKGEQIFSEAKTQDDSGREAKFFYFIGRLNPPHNGHLKALEILVKMANEQGSKPLILLGSGPGSERNMDNPISFEFKQHFISRVLNEKLPGSRFQIEKMTKLVINVSDYIRDGLNENLDKIQNIEIKHIAGGKDEDTTKLLFALKSAEKTARETAPEAEIITGVEPIEAETIEGETAMSATKVRKDAYNAFKKELGDEGNGFDIWSEKYRNFYGEDSEEMYNQILYPLKGKSREEQLAMIEKYLNPSVNPVGSKRKSKTGGTKRKKRKNKKKTQRRKKRLTNRRKY